MGLVTWLDSIDKQALIWCNQHHTDLLDGIMSAVTDKYIWLPFYVLLIFFIYRYSEKDWWLVLAILILSISFADLFASSLMKPWIKRLRPCHNDEISHLLNLPLKCGGKYGFISSHAANTFALATFMWLQFKSKYSWFSLLFVWAALVSYSRVYLGAHYPGDIIAGAISGILWGFTGIYVLRKLIRKRALIKRDSTFS